MSSGAAGDGRAVLLEVAGATAVGRSAAASAAAFRASLSGFSLRWSPRVAGSEAFTLAHARDLLPFDLDDGARPATPRLCALVELVASQLDALDDAREVPVFLGVPSPRPGFGEGEGAIVVDRARSALRGRGMSVEVHGVALDHAAGLVALARAVQAIEAREAEVCVAGGVDSYLAADTLAWLHARGQLKSGHNRWGFIAGEGAGLLLVASRAWAEARGRPVRAEVAAVATAREEVPPRTAEPQTAQGLSAALRGALAGLPEGARVDEVLSDFNGERWRGDELGFAVPRVAPRLASPGRLTTPAMSFGDVGAASGPLLAAVALHLASRGAARGPRALLLTSADDGARAAALLTIPCHARE